jgi:hypothetical protein
MQNFKNIYRHDSIGNTFVISVYRYFNKYLINMILFIFSEHYDLFHAFITHSSDVYFIGIWIFLTNFSKKKFDKFFVKFIDEFFWRIFWRFFFTNFLTEFFTKFFDICTHPMLCIPIRDEFFDEFFCRIFWRIFWRIFLTNFLT